MKKLTNRFVLFVVAVIASMVVSNTASAQFESSGIAVTASAKTEAPAQWMRMTMTIEAKGPDLKAAMESLAAKRKKATIKLEKLDAIEDSIKFKEVSTGGSSDSSEMAQMMKRRFGDDPRVAKMMKIKPPVTVTVALTADWKLEGEPDELLFVCDELKQEITGAEVAGGKDDGGLTEEQAELAEEMAEMMMGYSSSEETPAGTPAFFFIRTVSVDQQGALTGKAFSKAKVKAQRLADAAQLQLGKIMTLTSANDSMSAYMMQSYDSYGYGRSAAPRGETHEDGTLEVVGTSPSNIVHSATIAVAFAIDQ